MLDHPSCEGILPDVQPVPPLAQFEVIWEEIPTPTWLQPHQGIVESDKVPPGPLLRWESISLAFPRAQERSGCWWQWVLVLITRQVLITCNCWQWPPGAKHRCLPSPCLSAAVPCEGQQPRSSHHPSGRFYGLQQGSVRAFTSKSAQVGPGSPGEGCLPWTASCSLEFTWFKEKWSGIHGYNA